MTNPILRIMLSAVILCAVFPVYTIAADRSDLLVKVNEGKLQRLTSPVLDILITNPEIADIQLTQGNGLFVYGKRPGRTHIMALAAGDFILFNRHIQVLRELGPLRQLIQRKFPSTQISVEESPGRIIVEGEVSSALMVEQIISLVSGYLVPEEKIVNQLTLSSPMQVNLRVRIMEMSRKVTKEMGINWDILLNPGSLAVGLISGRSPLRIGGRLVPDFNFRGTGSSALLGIDGSDGSLSAVIDALAEDNLLTVLAEPNLTSRSGETASFFAGGEFPIPIAADDERITVEFKKFGVILDMTPTVISPNRISLHIRPEVSELSSVGAVMVQDIAIPGIAVRRTEATIELASGQSFSVAGLLQNQSRNLIREIPWLGEINVLGPLFRSSEYQKSETELVIVATANIVKPLSEDQFRSPLAGSRLSTESADMQKGSLVQAYPGRETEEIKGEGRRLYGPRGFIY